jgi:hypothetical protein
MNISKTFTLKWWQGGLFKWGMLALGIAIGAYWHEYFISYLCNLIAFSRGQFSIRHICMGEAIDKHTASPPIALEADNGSTTIFAPQTLGRLVRLAAGILAMYFALASGVRSGANSDTNSNNYGYCDCFR